MHPTRAWVLVSGAALWSSVLLICCGTDEALGPNDTPKGDLIGGEWSSADAGKGGAGARPSAGSGGMLTLGGSTSGPRGGAGEGGTLTSEGGMGPVTLGGEGGGDAEPPEEQLSFCPRLDAQTKRVGDAGRAYVENAYADCDTYWIIREVIDSGNDQYRDFRNALNPWSYNLWGCSDATPVTKFGLVWKSPQISAGDARRLIDIYVAAVDEHAALSPGEEAELRAALLRLSEQSVVNESLEPSQPGSNPKCQGAGGAGGAGGAEGAGDTGGAPTEPIGPAGQGGEP